MSTTAPPRPDEPPKPGPPTTPGPSASPTAPTRTIDIGATRPLDADFLDIPDEAPRRPTVARRLSHAVGAWLPWASIGAWLFALLIFAASLAYSWSFVRPQLGKPYSYDEAAFAFAGHAVSATGLPLSNVGHIQEETPGDFSKRFNWALWHPPLYVYALGYAFHRFGETEPVARLLGVLCNAAAALLLFATGTVMLSGRTRAAPLYGAMGALLYVTNPLVIQSALLLDIDGTVLVASIALLALAYVLLLRSPWPLRHRGTWLLMGAVTCCLALSLWAKMTTALAVVVAATLYRLIATRPWRPWRALVELPVIGLCGGALFLATWWAFALAKGMPFWFPFRILYLETVEAAGSTTAWRQDPRVLLPLLSQVALWISPYFALLFVWAGLARLYDLLVRPVVALGYRLVRRRLDGEPWGARPVDFLLLAGTAIATAYLIKLAASFPKYHISMMPFWAAGATYLLYRYVPRLSWWEVPVYGVVLSGMSGYFVSFVGDQQVLFRGWDFLFPLFVWPAALGFAFLVLGAALGKTYLPRQLAILGVVLTLAWSWGVDLAQAQADYSTAYNYGSTGQRETAARLNQILRPGQAFVAPREVAYYTTRSQTFVDQDVWTAQVDQLAAQGVNQFDGHLLQYDVDVIALFLWEPSLGQQAHSFLDAKYDVDFQSGPAGPYFIFVRTSP